MRPCIRRGSRSFFAGHGLCEQEQTSYPTCIVAYMFGSRQPHSVGGCALIVNLDCGMEAFLDSCKIFRKLPKGAHCSARLTEEMNQRHARGFENRQSQCGWKPNGGDVLPAVAAAGRSQLSNGGTHGVHPKHGLRNFLLRN